MNKKFSYIAIILIMCIFSTSCPQDAGITYSKQHILISPFGDGTFELVLPSEVSDQAIFYTVAYGNDAFVICVEDPETQQTAFEYFNIDELSNNADNRSIIGTLVVLITITSVIIDGIQLFFEDPPDFRNFRIEDGMLLGTIVGDYDDLIDSALIGGDLVLPFCGKILSSIGTGAAVLLGVADLADFDIKTKLGEKLNFDPYKEAVWDVGLSSFNEIRYLQFMGYVDDPPIFSEFPPGIISATVNEVINIPIEAWDAYNREDVLIGIDEGKVDMSFSNGYFSWIPGISDLGLNTVSIFAADEHAHVTLQSFNIYITNDSVAPEQAVSPNPSNNVTNVSISTDLNWANGGGATSYDVYFGTDSSPDSGESKGTQSSTSYDPGTLENEITYYWKIDSRNSAGTTTGTVWRFTTEAASVLNPPEIRIYDDNSDRVYPSDIVLNTVQENEVIAFEIYNAGESDLRLANTNFIEISGSNANDFSIYSNPSLTIATGGSTFFSIECEPTRIGYRYANITVNSNSNLNSSYTFTLRVESIPYTVISSVGESFTISGYNYTANSTVILVFRDPEGTIGSEIDLNSSYSGQVTYMFGSSELLKGSWFYWLIDDTSNIQETGQFTVY